MLGACAIVDSPAARRDRATAMALANGFEAVSVPSPPFVIAGFRRVTDGAADRLTVYVEGDGAAWRTRFHPAADPTPRRPVALALAVGDDSPAVLYLARPCQQVTAASRAGCAVRYWTSHRYSAAVVDSLDRVVDRAKASVGARDVELIGFSGGGVVAALLAARRGDVRLLVTVAANLDHAAWTEAHGLAPLGGSVSPLQHVGALRRVPQVHYYGDRDEIVPETVNARYFQALAGAPLSRHEVADTGHACCWAPVWPALIAAARDTVLASSPKASSP